MSDSDLLPASLVIQDDVVDSTRWSDFPFRADDIVIATFGKTGTTWVQQIVGQLIFEGADDVCVGTVSPWVEYRAAPWQEIRETLQNQRHRRFVKSHLPRPALPYCRSARYIYVARDARDQIWSAHNHLADLKPSALLSNSEGHGMGSASSMDVRAYYHSLMDRDAPAIWPYWSHVLSWWNARRLANVLLVHFSDLKSNLQAEIRRIACFLQMDVSDALLRRIVEHSEFQYMKRNAERFAGHGASALKHGPLTLINKGTNQRWGSTLSAEEIAKCDTVASRHLPADCASWLKYGSGAASPDEQSDCQAAGTAQRLLVSAEPRSE